MRFDLTDLQLFIHVAESGSITAGAQRAHLALPSASARIRGMEEALDVALLQRSRRGAEPTEAGRTLLQHARTILRQVEDMHADLAPFASGLKGQVRLLCNTSAMTEFLPDALAAFMAAHPQLSINLEERVSREIVRIIADGAADIGIISDSVDHGNLHTLPFRRDPLVLAMARGHPLARQLKGKRSMPFIRALEHDFIGLAGASALQQHVTEQAARLGRHLHVKIKLRSFEAICRMAAGGAGLAILPETAARRSPDALRIVRLADDWADRHLLICMRDAAELPAYARELAAALTGPAPASSG
ncbi:LysR family transcriptional regulator [Duganella callida]|uniref:LysR family transcriptional regulator n=1 Tax=Duganella callida TaxID=2561932 RepID=A0A4Y9SEY9_9BURK|nr:LysR family transcriptional regulator [Duganella callida]TFW18498.1 LysR family transcriptional regulator [Duganella callida]